MPSENKEHRDKPEDIKAEVSHPKLVAPVLPRGDEVLSPERQP